MRCILVRWCRMHDVSSASAGCAACYGNWFYQPLGGRVLGFASQGRTLICPLFRRAHPYAQQFGFSEVLTLVTFAAGSYRQLQARLRTNAESVAFYGGIEKEGALIRRSFSTLVAHQASLLGTQWRFSMWQVLP